MEMIPQGGGGALGRTRTSTPPQPDHPRRSVVEHPDYSYGCGRLRFVCSLYSIKEFVAIAPWYIALDRRLGPLCN